MVRYCPLSVASLGGCLVVLLAIAFARLGLVSLLPFTDLTRVGFLPIQIGEYEVEDIRIPVRRVALNTFLDILCRQGQHQLLVNN